MKKRHTKSLCKPAQRLKAVQRLPEWQRNVFMETVELLGEIGAKHAYYDEDLLERSSTQWQFGDWNSLAQLNRDTLQHHPDRAKLALLAAARRLQTDKADEARQYLRLARDWGVAKDLLARILAAGVQNSLGRAAAIAGEQPRALQHFHGALVTGTPATEARLLAQARMNHQ